MKSPHEKYAKELNSRFTIKKIESGELWLEDFESTGELTGPVLVSEEISSLCRVGWTVVLRIGKIGDKWRIINSKAVYPVTEYWLSNPFSILIFSFSQSNVLDTLKERLNTAFSDLDHNQSVGL